MTMFINQMMGCLIIAAGIGGAVGWLLRHVSAGKDAKLLEDVTAMMHLKEQMLEKARYQLREATSKLQGIENPEAAFREIEPQQADRNRCIDEEDRETLPVDKAA